MSSSRPLSKTTKNLLLCAPIGCLLFIILFLAQGAFRDAYSQLRFPVSSLSIGDAGWIQVTNFIVSGTLLLLFALGYKRSTPFEKGKAWTSRLLGAIGLGLIGAGIFSSDPVYGYPVTEPLALAQFSLHGHLHDLFSLFVFVCLPIACFRLRNRFREAGEKRWACYSLLSGIGFLAAFVLAAIGFKQVPGFVELAGLFQRLCLLIGFSWLSLLGVSLIRKGK